MAGSTDVPTARSGSAMRRYDFLWAGGGCGLLGGLAMLLIVTIGAVRADLGAAAPLEAIGATFVDAEGLSSGARIAWGLAVLALTSAGYGVLYAGLVPRELSTPSAAGLGLGYALLVLGMMMNVFVPWANPTFRGAMQGIGGTWIIAHAVYGLILGLVPAARRALAGERPEHPVGARPAPSEGR